MSTAVASASAAPIASPHRNRDLSPKNCPTMAPSASSTISSTTPPRVSVTSQHGSASKGSPSERKNASPSQNGSHAPKVIVKKEPPSSPGVQTQSHTRPRPRKLDLSTSLPNSSGLSARPPGGPMTAREGVTMQSVGIACLSPGFQTHDPIMREQLQRSLSVRDQQRSIIESRLQTSAKDQGPDGVKMSESSPFGLPKSGSSKRRPPPGLSIVPPSASHFSNERVVQSAPLHQTFTGGRFQPQPLTRHVANQSPTLGSSSHLHPAPATQTNNRLPPLSDVFGSDTLGSRDRDVNRAPYYQGGSGSNSSQSNNLPPLPSPGMPGSTTQAPTRPREYRSAEEAVHELSGGREELLPRIVHYGGHQPPTPPSPRLANGPPKSATLRPEGAAPASAYIPPPQLSHHTEGTARRRSRNEYEKDNGTPPLGHGPEPQYRQNPALGSGPHATYGPFGAGRDSPETQRRKKEEFLGLCARAWDLFHS
ncbi:hypothetical protein ASPWEDRAFT_324754 [Aspergillus wentii DTO 134E9]|uniref:Uncharacterized protein n=1 Tax=Aspergillus wentii DTO 134E9 TaxID=1073089 RepID=A0A1L9RU44_ASPWE|nr:uncharacterized protein ASPWEDRAFT_324754 [Aspergillus wentii DTO 134E9]OJJ38476.1 hypothetical protein ASPWEDRAFT_324754 [Aspergillus wentii DTO 134E9]